MPVPGYQVDVLNDDGKVVADGDVGSIMIKLPMPPGCLPTLWNKGDHFIKSYLSTHLVIT